jgi:hypothetical protein
MSRDTGMRMRVAALIFSMVNAVLFGLGLILVLSVRSLSENAFFLIPLVIVASFVLSPPIAWLLAPTMMQRFLKAPNPPIAARLSRDIEASNTP